MHVVVLKDRYNMIIIFIVLCSTGSWYFLELIWIALGILNKTYAHKYKVC